MRFYIACLANCVTGGTELLHQLSWCLTNRGEENYMLYVDAHPLFSPTADSFLKYQVTSVSGFVDDESSVLILPETLLEMVDICQKGTVVIWWLSVDNYAAKYKVHQQGKDDVFGLKEKENIIHFVQSRYAKEFVEKHFGVENVSYLKDYINEEIIQVAFQYNKRLPRENICLYNPKKGMENLRDIQNRCREDIEWIPITGLMPDQVAMLMCKAKVYIDFGNHPGKDRIPREAAVCGCCVITNREGSAVYSEDVGIPEKYKLSDMQDYDRVLETLYDLVDNYQERVEEYAAYVASILNEKEEFYEEVDNMLDIIRENVKVQYPLWKGNKYDVLFERMKVIAAQIHSIYKNAKCLYASREVDSAINELMKAESSLSMLRETSYTMINDMLLKE